MVWYFVRDGTDVRRDLLTATLRIVDDVTRPDCAVSTLAVFEVEEGRPGVIRA